MGKVQLLGSGTSSKKKRIGKKVGNVVAIMLVVSILMTTSLCVVMFHTLINGLLKDRCTSGTSVLSYALGRIQEGEDINLLLDGLKESTGCELTIFQGDTRAYTTVIQNGQRVVGTKLDSHLTDRILRQGQSYVGDVTILGREYLGSYVPTRDASGQVDGLLFAGISSDEAKSQTLLAVVLSGVVGFIALVVCVLILTGYLRSRVSGPLAEITRVAQRLEQGDLGVAKGEKIAVSYHSDDEIGELGWIFEDTIRRLSGYIGEISSVLDSISSGDLTNGPQQDYIGDFTSIRRSLEGIGTKLSDTIRQIRESAEQVSSGSEQVSGSAQALAQGATEQASSVQELSATISELADLSRRTAQATDEAGVFVEKAGGQLNISMEYVRKLNVAMNKISASSEEIGKIISTIENIAFQTNILALNAAVEAARAGAAGKGFAVVADEVRNLASKSDEAAKATKELIEGSITSVHEGSDVVSKVTEFLENTSEMAGGVTTQMAIVVDSVRSQTSAIGQINDGVEQISAVVQTNSATSEQSAAASEELSSQANLLKELVSSFHLGHGGRW